MKLPELRALIHTAIEHTEFAGKVYFAGGCVRDHLLGKESTDIDLTVELPEGGVRLAWYLHEQLGASHPIVYQRFGTAMTMFKGIKLETVMTRAESYRPQNRNPKVCHSDLYNDVMRRDFTVNSLLMSVADGCILDLCERGRQDLADGIIRCVREPQLTFGEDPLRLLRGIRFALRLGFEIEPITAAGIRDHATDLQYIKQERIAEEFNKLIVMKDIERTMRLLESSGVLAQILPEVAALQAILPNRYHHLNGLEHTFEVLRYCPPEPLLRWAALLHDVGKVQCEVLGKDNMLHYYGHEIKSAKLAASILKRFMIAAQDSSRITKAIAKHMVYKNIGYQAERISLKSLRKLILLPEADVELLLSLIHADNLSHAPDYCMPEQIPCLREQLSKELKKLSGIRFNLTGKDLISELGVQQGPLVGKLLKIAKHKWLEDPEISQEALMRILREKL
ncbi:MAG: hypothetical protein CVU48_02160 [Candidatus Cloacimonetes bacterium HGW-Cloacimonetes-1]|jgi:tRNA nucleotidyltransferase/poly(A) polymerase|nr:MAG: hypothetical protein CVU48_02160 [Candidatus Cloacimonetes bacterium HGW-Cloacimonetes-1]